jgi:hypothetical protein
MRYISYEEAKSKIHNLNIKSVKQYYDLFKNSPKAIVLGLVSVLSLGLFIANRPQAEISISDYSQAGLKALASGGASDILRLTSDFEREKSGANESSVSKLLDLIDSERRQWVDSGLKPTLITSNGQSAGSATTYVLTPDGSTVPVILDSYRKDGKVFSVPIYSLLSAYALSKYLKTDGTSALTSQQMEAIAEMARREKKQLESTGLRGIVTVGANNKMVFRTWNEFEAATQDGSRRLRALEKLETP